MSDVVVAQHKSHMQLHLHPAAVRMHTYNAGTESATHNVWVSSVVVAQQHRGQPAVVHMQLQHTNICIRPLTMFGYPT
jgi:hypothetical protein